MERSTISQWQFFIITLNFTLGTTFFIRPGALIATAKQDAWIVPWWVGAAGLATALIWLKLYRLHPGRSLIQICTGTAGKAVGGFFALLYIFFFIQITAWVTRNLGDFMKTTLMPETPISMFHLMFLAVAAYAVCKGVETIARVNESLTPLLGFTFVMVVLFSLTEWEWYRFEPVLQMDFWKTVRDTRSLYGFPYLEMINLAMLFPYVKGNPGKSLLPGIAAATGLLSLIIFFTIGILGVYRASHLIYPLYNIAEELRAAPFIEHVESAIAVVWLTSLFLKLSIALYCSTIALCDWFGLTNRRGIVLPLVFLVSGLAMTIMENNVVHAQWDMRYTFTYFSLFGVVLPVVLLVWTWIRNRFISGGKEGASS